MSLQHLIEQYIAFQQALGKHFKSNAYILRAFSRAIGQQDAAANICTEKVKTFLMGKGPRTLTWHKKLSILRSFYQYTISRGYMATVSLPTVIPKRPPTFTPYIYSCEELRRLLAVIASDHRSQLGLEPVTLRTIILLLYGAGLRLQEALNLNRVDVDLDNSLLTIRQTKFDKTRLVPFGLQLGRTLSEYAKRLKTPQPEVPFFTMRAGTRVKAATLQNNFRFVCEQADVRRSDGREQPRLHDLRHTFAVHRLTTWYRQGANVQRLIHHLSVYLGHAYLSSTQVYLTMTPELLQQAGLRFERYARGEGGHA